MHNVTIDNIVKACNGSLVVKEYDKTEEAISVVIDSRLVEAGSVFIATKGERVDGHSFIKQVFEKGALAVICQTLPEDDFEYGPLIVVEDSFKALRDLALFYRQQLSCKFVGITGSVGKTSSKEFIAGVLAVKYKVLKTAGNFNNEIGVPLTVLSIKEEHEIAVIEMGINHFGEMSRLTAIVKPDVAVMTNIGECHLEFLNNRDGVLKAKSEIFEGLAEDGHIVVNADDDKLMSINQVKGIRPVRFGFNEKHDYYADNIKDKGLHGTDIRIVTKTDSFEAHVPLPGRHMVNNALAAAAVGRIFNMTNEEIALGIKNIKALAGRSNIIEKNNHTIIDDCYNANPVSVKAAIDLLTLADSRKVAILGDMFELGPNELELHKEVGEYAAAKNIDLIICIGELSKAMYEAAKLKAVNSIVYGFSTREEAVNKLGSIIKDKDSILVKASHGMHFEEIVEIL